ncbi:hypothetical protein SDC9_134142 [bioreactor metagenome]|uniref:Uncharacterized protein n=1 Tax=bioreactor metagenome TaxID=1076179 RepID=A0A645DCU2_9ZZZZ
MVVLPQLLEARIRIGVHQLEVTLSLHAQTEALDFVRNHLRTTNQDRTRHALIQHGLHRPQHLLGLTPGKDDALGCALGGDKHRLHQHAGVPHEVVQLATVGIPVGDRTRCHTGRHRRLGDSRCNLDDQARIEGFRDNVLGAKLLVIAQGGDGFCRGQLHLFGDIFGFHHQSALEDAGEDQDIVDLVGVIAAAGGDDVSPASLCVLRHDLRRGVGHREDHGLLRHGGNHLGRHDIRRGYADKYVFALDDLAQRAALAVLVGHLGHSCLRGVHPFLALFQSAHLIHQHQVTGSHLQYQLGDGNAGGAGAVDHDADILPLFAGYFQRVDQAGDHHDGRAVLVIVKYGDVQLRLQPPLDLKAARR